MELTMKKELSLKNVLTDTFWNEIGNTIRPEQLLEKVYHYTSLEGLIGILSNKQVWMTNSNFLNDMTELNYFQTLTDEAKDLFEKILSDKYSEEEINKDDLLNIFIKTFDEAVLRRYDPKWNFEVYVMSLSENDDSLTLWGNYAKGKGYNICFNAKSLISKVDEIGSGYVVYNKVIYNRDKQLETLRDALVKTFEILLKNEFEVINLIEDLLLYFNNLIISYSIFFKHHSFEQEEEFRIAFTTNGNTDVNFRTNGEAIIPYIKMNFEESDINGIVIGPKNNSDIAKIGVRTYLEKLGYGLSEVSVEKSIIPLRF